MPTNISNQDRRSSNRRDYFSTVGQITGQPRPNNQLSLNKLFQNANKF